MRPGALSKSGFLGPGESLAAVLAEDAHALARIGVSFEALAAAVETLIAAANAAPSHEAVAGQHHVRIQQYLGFQICPFAPDLRSGQCAGRGLPLSSIDWRIENRATGQAMEGPGLIVHLMHDHHFCEGPASPRRVDPVALAALLGLTESSADRHRPQP